MDNMFRAKKILGPMDSFEILDNLPEALFRKITPNIMGALVGVYRNSPQFIEDCVVVFENGLQVIGKESTALIYYREVTNIESPKDKVSYNSLKVTLKSGEKFIIPVRNGNGKYRDSFEFLRFIDRVSSWYDGSWHERS